MAVFLVNFSRIKVILQNNKAADYSLKTGIFVVADDHFGLEGVYFVLWRDPGDPGVC